MVKLGIKELDNIISPYKIVELEADWSNHILELADIIFRLARQGQVHILFVNSSKYIDIDKFYLDLEPFIEDIGDIKIYWAKNIETLAYHLLLTPKTKKGYIIVILPYRRDLVSQIENTYTPRLKHSLQIAADKGWSIIIVNPLISEGVINNYLGEISLRIRFGKGINYVEILNRAIMEKPMKIF